MPTIARRLTVAWIERQPYTESGQLTVKDSPGPLRLVIGMNSRTYYAQCYAGGRQKMVKLGSAHSLPLDDARRRAAKAYQEFSDRGSVFFADSLDFDAAETAKWQELAHQVALGKRAQSTFDWYRQIAKHHLGTWRGRKLATISRAEVHSWHRQLTKSSGASIADSAIRTLSAIWSHSASLHPDVYGANPCIGHVLNASEPVEIDTSPTMYATVTHYIAGMENPVRRSFFRLCLFTGLRPYKEVAQLRKTDVDLRNQCLTIRDPKGGRRRAHVVPLDDRLAAIVAEQMSIQGEWLFPAQSRSGHLVTGLPDAAPCRTYDLKRLYVSAGYAVVPRPMVSALVGHRTIEVITDVYARHSIDALRPAQAAIGDEISRRIQS